MAVRRLVIAWLVVGVIVWIGVFALHVENGVQVYLRRLAEFEAGQGAEPPLAEVMAGAQARGAWQASLWALFVSGAGWLTIWWTRAGRRRGD